MLVPLLAVFFTSLLLLLLLLLLMMVVVVMAMVTVMRIRYTHENEYIGNRSKVVMVTLMMMMTLLMRMCDTYAKLFIGSILARTEVLELFRGTREPASLLARSGTSSWSAGESMMGASFQALIKERFP
jgi:amino acid permease